MFFYTIFYVFFSINSLSTRPKWPENSCARLAHSSFTSANCKQLTTHVVAWYLPSDDIAWNHLKTRKAYQRSIIRRKTDNKIIKPERDLNPWPCSSQPRELCSNCFHIYQLSSNCHKYTYMLFHIRVYCELTMIFHIFICILHLPRVYYSQCDQLPDSLIPVQAWFFSGFFKFQSDWSSVNNYDDYWYL